jgi:starvation-inducible outer membrane lipoprotein
VNEIRNFKKPEGKMKKRMITFLVIIAMSFMCFGCTNAPANLPDDTQGNESEEVNEEDSYRIKFL